MPADSTPLPFILLQARLPLRDPHDCTDAADELALYRALYDTLVAHGPDGFRPRLARAWQVSPDARLWRFRLRPGAMFHDGTACDAHAVKRCLMRMARPDKGYTLGSPAVWRSYLAGAEITAGDDATLSIALPEPMADLLDILAQAFIVSPAGLDALDAGRYAEAPGSGPFRLVEARTDSLLLARFAHHAGRRLTNAVMRIVAEPDRARRLEALCKGEADAATDLDFAQSAVLPHHDATRVAVATPVSVIFMMNAAQGPLRDPRLRRALSLALDRQALITSAAAGAGLPLAGFIGPLHFGAPEHETPLPDPEAAQALIAQAWPEGSRMLTLDCPTSLPEEAEALAAGLRAQLARLDIDSTIRIHHDREAYAHQVRRKEIGDLCVFDSSPVSTFRVLVEKLDSRVRGAWWQGYANAEVEAAIDAGRAEPDQVRRAGHYARAWRIMQQDPPWLTLYNPVRVIGLAGHHPAYRPARDGVVDYGALPAAERSEAEAGSRRRAH